MKNLLSALLFVGLTFTAPLAAKTKPQSEAVVSSAHPLATEAGAEILRKGGSAADAAMAMMLALTVVEPQSSGIGGGGFLVHFEGRQGTLTTINGRETAPAAATPQRFLGADGKPLPFLQAFPGGKSVGVPGNIRLMADAHAKWGKLKWAELFKPAIRLAEKGFVVNKTLESRLTLVERLWPQFDKARSIYWVDGKPAKAGVTIRNPELAATLRTVATKGPDGFYSGIIANAIVDTVAGSKVAPGDLALSDLATYQAREQNAVCAPYRIYVVCGMAPPSSGATTVLQILGSLQRFDLKTLGKDNPQSWHLLGQAMQLAYADREKYLGDSEFVVVPVAGLLDPAYLAQRSALIDPAKARSDYPAGNPPGALPRTAALSGETGGTTHFTAIDAKGNIANMTSTIEGVFGSQLIAGGFFLNNELTDFTFAPEKDGAPVANRVEGGKATLVFDGANNCVRSRGACIAGFGFCGREADHHACRENIGRCDRFRLAAERCHCATQYLLWRWEINGRTK